MRNKLALLFFELLLIVLIPFGAKGAPVDMPTTANVLTLAEAIDTALANNQSIIQANLGVDIADARYQETTRAFKPQVALSQTAGRQYVDSYQTKAYNFASDHWQKVTTNEMYQYNYDTKITLQLPLYTGLRLEANQKQSAQTVEQTKANALKARQGLVLDTTTAYFTLLQSYNTLELTRQSTEQMQAHLKNATLNYDNGIVAKSDVLRAEVELAAAEQNQAKAENSVELAKTTLCNIMGVDLHTKFRASNILSNTYPLQTIDHYLASARQERPELAAIKAQLNGAQAAITATKSGNLPTLNLTGTYDWKGNSFLPGDDSWSIMLSANWNAFDGGITASRVTQAQKNYNISQSQERQLLDNITLEVTQAYFNLQDAAKRLATAQKADIKSDEDFRIAQLRYKSGLNTNVEVLDSHVAFLNAKNSLIQTQFDYHTSYARLLKAAGILNSSERMTGYEQ
ncbi:TolC family protein [Sporomusa sphaeroides]|uniref:TolC family protein n=1 Tax=Sporomusa sphaeroides TaxID=47679 RepID=UPI002B8A255D|nr:TolC family protein [Sporomusa sphaeroides]HML31977.1 TolC family protein [Sporomusa sphaeroides]